jgi:hypothetical protein
MAEMWPGGPLTLPHSIVHDGIELTVPELPVNDLFYWLASGQWWQLYPNALPNVDTEPLRKRLFDPKDDLDLIHLHDVATRLFGRLSGMAPPQGTGWWPSVRLANVALVQWPLFNAWCTAHGVAPFGGTLMTTVSASYAWMREGLHGEQMAKFEQALWEAPPVRSSAAAVEPEELPEHLRQEEASAFLAALGESLPGQQMSSGIY